MTAMTQTPSMTQNTAATAAPADPIPASLGNIALAERTVHSYTSYPTAPHFTPSVTADTYRGWLGTLSPCTSLSLYLHVPFCAAMCAYCGCHTKVTRKAEPIAAYRDRLLAEIDLIASLTPARRVKHLHWGGGTPTMLG